MRKKNKVFFEISRRGFIQHLSWSIIGGAMTASGILFTATKTAAYPMPKGDLHMSMFNSNMFTGLVGESFNLEGGCEGILKAVLIEVTEHTAARQDKDGSANTDCFSILFRIPSGQHLEQNTYSFFHKRIGTFPLFIVPVGIDEQGRLYEAVFNRLIV